MPHTPCVRPCHLSRMHRAFVLRGALPATALDASWSAVRLLRLPLPAPFEKAPAAPGPGGPGPPVLLEELPQPVADADQRALAPASTDAGFECVIGAHQREPGRGCELRALHRVREAAETVAGDADAHRHAEGVLCDLGRAPDPRTTARQHGAGAQLAAPARVLDLARDEAEDLIEALLDDVCDQLARDEPLGARSRTGQLHAVAGIDELRVRDAVLLLRLLRLRERDRQTLREIVRHGRAAPRDRGEVAHLAFAEDGELRRRTSEIHERDSDVLLVIGKHGVRGRERLVDRALDAVAGAAHGLAQVLARVDRARDDVDLGLEARARHADRVANAALVVDDVLLRQHVQHLAIGRYDDGASDLVHALYVRGRDLLTVHCDDAVRRARVDVLARDTGEHALAGYAGHQLGFLHRGAHGIGRALDVGDDLAAHSAGLRLADAQHFNRRLSLHDARDFGDHGARLRRSDIQAGNEVRS